MSKTTPSKKRDAADQQLYDQGRAARASSIARGDSPHSAHTAKRQRKLWTEGWDFEDEQRSGRG